MAHVKKLNIDKIGACASAICAVHCLLTGVAVGLLSVLGLGFLGSTATDVVFLGIAMLTGFLAVRHGIKLHRSYLPALIFVAGLAFIVIGHFAFDHDHSHGHADFNLGSTLFSVLGALSLVGFHLLNLKMQRERSCCHEPHCEHE